MFARASGSNATGSAGMPCQTIEDRSLQQKIQGVFWAPIKHLFD